MRRSVLAILMGMVALFSTALVFADPPEHITIDACMDRRAAVEFPHAAHFEVIECANCHHTQEDLTADSGVTAEACTSCHKEPEKAETPDCAQTSTKKNPFHITCIACHKEKKEGPSKCNDCHPRE